MDQATLDRWLADGSITAEQHAELSSALEAKHRRDEAEAQMEEEGIDKKQFFAKAKTATLTTLKAMAKQKSAYLSLLAAEEEDQFEARELRRKASRFARAVRGSGTTQY